MKIVIDALDKIYGDVVSCLVEKMSAYSCKTLWQRRKIDCCAHFILRWGSGGISVESGRDRYYEYKVLIL
ncbi:hypothetical protein [Holospora undulata]|uniref:hypothetical protein n=1 Tax=Holospora undulata TaxID=1169117 RepID=UPI0013922F5F|nr:hypothetical protein [Holospora undulata]